MVQAVTGSGKTLLALTGAKRLEEMTGLDLRVKIVVPTSALMGQWNKALREFLTEEEIQRRRETDAGARGRIGLRGNGHKSPLDCKYMIYVINSARYELARQILKELKEGKAVLLIADECHHYESEQNRLIFEFYPYIKQYKERFFSLGLSATLPSGQAWLYLSSVLGKRIYSYGMEQAAARGTVCQYDIFHVELSFQAEERDQYEEMTDRMMVLYRSLVQVYPHLRKMNQKRRYEVLRSLTEEKDKKTAREAALYMNLSYKRRSLVCQAAARVSCVCELIKGLEPGEKVLIFGERIRQAEELYKLLNERYPARVGRYHSQMGDQANKNILERFRQGDIRILIACKAMDEGVDVPDVSVGIILSGTSAQRQRIQRLGRIIRKKEGKTRASLYYLHIAQTAEDICFLPDAGENHLIDLEYMSETGEFHNTVYDEKAVTILEKVRKDGISEDRIEEIKRCLKLGCVRSDWTQPMSYIDEQIKKSDRVRDKNYWVCMKMLNQ